VEEREGRERGGRELKCKENEVGVYSHFPLSVQKTERERERGEREGGGS